MAKLLFVWNIVGKASCLVLLSSGVVKAVDLGTILCAALFLICITLIVLLFV